jgi:hypothetical protein
MLEMVKDRRNRRTKKNKRSGGGSCGAAATAVPEMPKMQGGKRRNKTRKMAKGASQWNKKVMEIYHKMKKDNPEVKLGEAMKRASELKKKGQL